MGNLHLVCMCLYVCVCVSVHVYVSKKWRCYRWLILCMLCNIMQLVCCTSLWLYRHFQILHVSTYFQRYIMCWCVLSVYMCAWCPHLSHRELQSVKSTLTFMVLTSQGHPKAEHLKWSVTFQTENNSRVFSGLWRWLFILSLTHFDLARGNNGLSTLVFLFHC